MPALKPCARNASADHFTVRPLTDNLGCERAGQDQVKRRGQATILNTTSCPPPPFQWLRQKSELAFMLGGERSVDHDG